MMLCLDIVMTTTMNGFIENTKFEYVEGASRMIVIYRFVVARL